MDIATLTIEAVFPGSARQKVILRLGAPFERDAQWWIRTELENLDSSDGPIAGADSFHTLILGIAWVVLRLERYEKLHGCRYFWEGTEEPFDYRTQFIYDFRRSKNDDRPGAG